MEELTPRQVVEELDKYIIGQDKAKRSVAIAMRNRYRRRQLDPGFREEVIPKNILMIGPTGVGKTEIARRLARLAKSPMIKVEATKFTEVGYVGRDVDAMVRDLVDVAVRMVEEEKFEAVKDQAEQLANERIIDLMQPLPTRQRRSKTPIEALLASSGEEEPPKEDTAADDQDYHTQVQQTERVRAWLRDQLMAGKLEDREIELEMEESKMPTFQMFSSAGGFEEMGINLKDLWDNMMPKQKKKRRLTVAQARQFLVHEEARNLIDGEEVTREAIDRAQESGIIFVDELDKVAGRESGHGPDVSREGVQRDILPIVEGCTVTTKHGPVNTHHILFIAAGAFHISKPSDLIPELQGRFPIRVELDSLTEKDFERILTEPRNAMIKQYTELLKVDGAELVFTEDGITTIAQIACLVNQQTENIGARRLHTILERLLEEVSFAVPDLACGKVLINAAYVRERLDDILKSEDMSRYIL